MFDTTETMTEETIGNNPWLSLDLSTVNPNMESIPVGDYNFRLGGATYKKYANGIKVDVNATVEGGEFAGRRMYFSYLDPSHVDLHQKFLKRLEVAIGAETTGLDPVSWINQNAGAIFNATVKHTPEKNGYPAKNEIDISKVRPQQG